MLKLIVFILLSSLPILGAAQQPEIIDGKQFEKGLQLERKDNILIRNCQITNPDGTYGISLKNCKNVRIENCTVRRIGNESVIGKNIQYKGDKGQYEFEPKGIDGIRLEDCYDVRIYKSDITDVFGRGVHVLGRSWQTTGNITVEESRIAYVDDDGILFHSDKDQANPEAVLPLKGGKIINNVIHDVGLGLTRLAFARHGMYLKTRDVLVEGNRIYNCFYGQGISLRNAGIIRHNTVWNCRGGIAYWSQTNTEGSTRRVLIEDNNIRQDFAMVFPMRHIDFPERIHSLTSAGIVFQLPKETFNQMDSVIIRHNTILIRPDYVDEAAVVGGSGIADNQKTAVHIYGNTLTDQRTKANFFVLIPPTTDTTKNVLTTQAP